MSEKLQVMFTTENYDKVLYMILRLFFGKYDEDNGGKTNYRLSEFQTQESIKEAIRIASEGRHNPAQSAISKQLTNIKGTLLLYNNGEYRLKKVNGYYKITDGDDFVASAKYDLTEYRKYLSRAAFRNNISQNQISSLYAFKLDTDFVSVSKLKDTFQRALGSSYFEMIEHGKTLFLLLNANSKKIIADAKWLNDYFVNYDE